MIKEFGLLTNLARINIIAGKNGVGKTKLLERIRDTRNGVFLDETFAMFNGDYPIILIDGIENGIHHSIFDDMWQAYWSMAISKDIQVFAITYSLEVIHSAHKILGADLMYYRLYESVKSGKVEVVNYTARILESAIELDFEIR